MLRFFWNKLRQNLFLGISLLLMVSVVVSATVSETRPTLSASNVTNPTITVVASTVTNSFAQTSSTAQPNENLAATTTNYVGDAQIQDGAVKDSAPTPQHVISISDLPRKSVLASPPSNIKTLDMRILVLSADGNEEDLLAIQQTLDYSSIPYTAIKTAPQPQNASTDRLAAILSDGNMHAYYQGIILATSQELYKVGTSYQSALTTTEWNTLRSFEAKFGVREIAWYTYPTSDYGFEDSVTPLDTTQNPLSAQFTNSGAISGQSIFSFYVNTNTPLTIKNAYTYLAHPLKNNNTFPLLVDSNGNALAVIHKTADNRQTLALTFDSNPDLIHIIVVSYGLVNWLTNGLFLGNHHIYLTVQPDDIFIGNYVWKPGSPCDSTFNTPDFTFYRLTANDLQAFAAWQKVQQAKTITPNFKLELPFVGIGTTGVYRPDTLTPAAQKLVKEFNWVTHTYDHTDLTKISYDHMMQELEENRKVAVRLGLINGTNYSVHSMITPNVSGLQNPPMFMAAYANNIYYLVSNTSVSGYNNPAPNIGIYASGSFNGGSYNVFLVPRHPSDLYFNVTTPDEWLSEDQCNYPTTAFGHVDTYQQLVNRESQNMLTYLLKGDMDPLMFHQPNMRAYDGSHSLLSDLLDATLTKYQRYFTLPIISDGGQPIPASDPICGTDLKCTQGAMDRLGYHMSKITDYRAADVTASIVDDNSIILVSDKTVTVPVTGLPLNTTCASCSAVETYGGQTMLYVSLKAGQSLTLPLNK